jgi:hypothetical protein
MWRQPLSRPATPTSNFLPSITWKPVCVGPAPTAGSARSPRRREHPLSPPFFESKGPVSALDTGMWRPKPGWLIIAPTRGWFRSEL